MPRSRARSSGRADRSRAGSSSPAARRPPRPIRRVIPGSRSVATTGNPFSARQLEERPVHRELGPALGRPAESAGRPRRAPRRSAPPPRARPGDSPGPSRTRAPDGYPWRGSLRGPGPGSRGAARCRGSSPEVHDLRGPGAVRDLARRRVDVGLGLESEHWPRLRGGPGAGAPGEEQAGREDPHHVPRGRRRSAAIAIAEREPSVASVDAVATPVGGLIA